MTLAPHRREMVEGTLGRPLSDEELTEVPTLEALSIPQLAVLDKLSRLQIIAYLHYLQAIVPHVTMTQATRFMEQLHARMPDPHVEGRAHMPGTARSSPECRLYIELNPCECGESRLDTVHRVTSSKDGLLAIYEGKCPRCGAQRRFDFVLDPEIPPGDKFGGSRASTIIDAGQFLAVADHAAKQVPHDTSKLDEEARRTARWWLSRAVNALEEVLKFVPPDRDDVPPIAFFTDMGRDVYSREPGRFRRARLEAVLGVYRDLLGRL